MRTWADRIADFLLSAYRSEPPDDVLHRARLQLLDTLACAAGAVDAAPTEAALRSIEDSGPKDAAVWFSQMRASAGDAVLVNGTATRFLDANDVFLGSGPGGHPSDNIPVVVAAAEKWSSAGRDLLTAIALAYELVFRLRAHIYRKSPRGSDWHEVSISGVVASSITALLAGATSAQLSNAISIGAAKGYALKEIRRGQISMLKAAGNAVVAREGVMAAHLALSGMSGPPQVFEGSSGLVTTLGGTPTAETIEQICSSPEWSIRRVSVKPYPAFGTSQSSIVAAVSVAPAIMDPSQVEEIVIGLRDTPWTRDYLGLPERRAPETRETADHSLQFLVAVALLHGGISQSHYERRLWEDETIRSLMRRTLIEPRNDFADSDTCFPAAISVLLRSGETLSATVEATPGSPDNPWGADQIMEKLRRLDRVGMSDSRIEQIGATVMELGRSTGVRELRTVLS